MEKITTLIGAAALLCSLSACGGAQTSDRAIRTACQARDVGCRACEAFCTATEQPCRQVLGR